MKDEYGQLGTSDSGSDLSLAVTWPLPGLRLLFYIYWIIINIHMILFNAFYGIFAFFGP